MVKFYSGVAGARGSNPRGVVIHNDGGSQNATAGFYRGWLPTHDAELGFAHVYIGSDGKFQAEAFGNMAWHTANATGNAYYVGWEVCQSMGNEATFLANEQAVFKDVAAYMKSIGMTPNRSTVMLHREFSATSCPHRSWALHGQSVNAVKDYYIANIAKYMGATTPTEPSVPENTNKDEDDIMFKYIKVNKNGSAEIWFVMSGERMYLPTNTHVQEVDAFLKRMGKSTREDKYNYDNFMLRAIEKTYKDNKAFQ